MVCALAGINIATFDVYGVFLFKTRKFIFWGTKFFVQAIFIDLEASIKVIFNSNSAL